MNSSILDGRGKIWDQKMREEKYHKTFSGWEQASQLSHIILFLLFPIQERSSSSRPDPEGHFAKGSGLTRAEEWRQPGQDGKRFQFSHVSAAACLPHLISCGQNKQPHRSRDMGGRE